MMSKTKLEDYAYMIVTIQENNINALEEIACIVIEFPQGKDPVTGRAWIMNAIDLGSVTAIEWILSQRVEINFVDEEGCSPLLSAVNNKNPDRFKIMELLL